MNNTDIQSIDLFDEAKTVHQLSRELIEEYGLIYKDCSSHVKHLDSVTTMLHKLRSRTEDVDSSYFISVITGVNIDKLNKDLVIKLLKLMNKNTLQHADDTDFCISELGLESDIESNDTFDTSSVSSERNFISHQGERLELKNVCPS